MDDIAATLASKLDPLPGLSRPADGFRHAAVLVPIVDHPGAPTVLLTRRAAHLRNHAGQVSFPGGKLEAADASPLAAAMRETFEEIGLGAEFIQPVGALSARETVGNVIIQPLVAIIRPGFSLKSDPAEVYEILELPLMQLLDARNHQHHRTHWEGAERAHSTIHFDGQIIWGATAGILMDLYARLMGPDRDEAAALSLARQPWVTDPATRRLFAALEAKGSPARFVGGCVRNALIGQPISDIDIATPEEPQAVLELLANAGIKAVPTGIEHGTVTAVVGRKAYEVTSLRRDVVTDGRRAVVTFTRDFAEDAARRDFTMNAIYADETGLLYDYVFGVPDLLTHRVRFIGEPAERIREDYLRILRFFRFHAWYGRGDPDAAGLAAASALKSGLSRLSAERVAQELLKLLAAPDPRSALQAMQGAGILTLVFPEAEDLVRLGRLMAAETAMGLAPDSLLRIAALMPADPARAEVFASRLKLANDIRRRLAELAHDEPDLAPGISAPTIRAFCYRNGFSLFRDRVLLRWARSRDAAFTPAWPALIAVVERWTVPRFPLTGADLVALGIPEGPKLGRLLAEREEAWIASDFKLDRAALLDSLPKMI